MTSLYFDCTNGISGDMSVGALLDLGADRKKLDKALKSIALNDEFDYEIKKTKVNSISATDFDVIMHHKHHHEHRNLDDVIKIIDIADMTQNAKKLAKKIFNIVAQAEAKVHNEDIKNIHFHEVGAIDSIADIISFSVLFDDISKGNVYFSTLGEGTGSIVCQHGELSVPVPAVLEIISKYQIPIKITDNQGEMVTPTGAAIAASLYKKYDKLPQMIIRRTGYGSGKRPYKNPCLRIIEFNEEN